jgi:rhodanese-related sulfurtransferase
LVDWRQRAAPHRLVDVREPSEHEALAIDGAELIPLADVEAARDRLPSDVPVVIYCRTGARSARAVATLRGLGVDARNLVGGIEGWFRTVR